MPTLDASTPTLSRDEAAGPLEITCEPAVGVNAEQVILQLACALARLAAREDDERENAGLVAKRE